MTTLMVKDLYVNEELDCQTMSAIAGGSSLLEWFGYRPETGGSIGKQLDDTLHGTISNMG